MSGKERGGGGGMGVTVWGGGLGGGGGGGGGAPLSSFPAAEKRVRSYPKDRSSPRRRERSGL